MASDWLSVRRILQAELPMGPSPPSSFVIELARALERLRVKRTGVVVAVSGGPDSMALTCGLLALGWGDAERPLVAAHLNHALRGSASDADEAFVRAEVDRLGAGRLRVRLVTETVRVANVAAQRGLNVEAAARQLRYQWLAKVAADAGLIHVATGHTADDQAETVLHNVLRGTGLAGLRGIAWSRRLGPGVRLVRPLLAVGRADVLAYLRELGQPYREDASNRDLARTRNRIRHGLLPLLATNYNPRVVRQLGRLAAQARAAHRVLVHAAHALLRQAEQPRAEDIVVLQADPLASAEPVVAAEAFRQIWRRQRWPRQRMDSAAWHRLVGVARGTSVALDLPGGVSARLVGRVVQLRRAR